MLVILVSALQLLKKKIKQTSSLKVFGILHSSNCFSLHCENSPLSAKHTCYHWYFLFAYLCITVLLVVTFHTWF